MKYFAGIGARDTPRDIEYRMTDLSKILTSSGYTLRSGNADGSDQAFAKGVVDNNAQIWLPWIDFNEDFRLRYPDHDYRLVYSEDDIEAVESVKKFHPYYEEMSKKHFIAFEQFMNFMTRNYRQVRGFNQPDSEFVICWTFNGEDVGGTGQAIRVARHYNIPVYNLYHLSVDEVLKEIEKLQLLN